ncbi:MAG: hypothetical protein Q4B96_01455 [Bacillota bacterium]|nr:hypothetical protein [Bacillota bacterium]
MFPLVHYYVNKRIYGQVPPLMTLGGFFPDLASGTGMERDAAHMMGDGFHGWCKRYRPQALPLALGILSHGTEPHGVDYYADEYWPDCEHGWCFKQGERYMDEVRDSTHLGEDYIWWKAHNFVEMSYELIIKRDQPQTNQELIAALTDYRSKSIAAEALSAYSGRNAESIIGVYNRALQIFAIREVTALALAQKQADSFIYRFNMHDAEPLKMAALLEKMSRELSDGFYPYIEQVIALTAEMLGAY